MTGLVDAIAPEWRRPAPRRRTTPAPGYDDLQPLQDQFFAQQDEEEARRFYESQGLAAMVENGQAQPAPNPYEMHTPLERGAIGLGDLITGGAYTAGNSGARLARGDESAAGDLAMSLATMALTHGSMLPRGEPAPMPMREPLPELGRGADSLHPEAPRPVAPDGGGAGADAPIDVFHGTPRTGKNSFLTFSHHGTRQAARDRLQETGRRGIIGPRGEVLTTQIAPGRVIDLPGDADPVRGVFSSPQTTIAELARLGTFTEDELRYIREPMDVARANRQPGEGLHFNGMDPGDEIERRAAEVLTRKGIVALRYQNAFEHPGSFSYVVPDPANVRVGRHGEPWQPARTPPAGGGAPPPTDPKSHSKPPSGGAIFSTGATAILARYGLHDDASQQIGDGAKAVLQRYGLH